MSSLSSNSVKEKQDERDATLPCNCKECRLLLFFIDTRHDGTWRVKAQDKLRDVSQKHDILMCLCSTLSREVKHEKRLIFERNQIIVFILDPPNSLM